MRFSANTGFLFGGLAFNDRILAAAAAGFGAVEFHDEAQDADPDRLRAVLDETGLPVCGLNIRMGATAGCAAIPGAERRFEADMVAAAAAAEWVGAAAIHVLAGKCEGIEARRVYLRNLRHALRVTDRTILIEPICSVAVPGYYLNDLDLANDIVEEIANPRLKIMFDCYHIETEHGQCLDRLVACLRHVGHIQIAAIPNRDDPDQGDIDFRHLLRVARDGGYGGDVGMEYQPVRPPAEVLGVMSEW